MRQDQENGTALLAMLATPWLLAALTAPKERKRIGEETRVRRRERMRKNILTAAILGFDQAVCGKAPFYEKLPYTRLGGNSCAFAVHAVWRLIP